MYKKSFDKIEFKLKVYYSKWYLKGNGFFVSTNRKMLEKNIADFFRSGRGEAQVTELDGDSDNDDDDDDGDGGQVNNDQSDEEDDGDADGGVDEKSKERHLFDRLCTMEDLLKIARSRGCDVTTKEGLLNMIANTIAEAKEIVSVSGKRKRE